MEDPGKNKRKWVVDVVIILLLITMIYVLYSLIGGDWSVWDMSGEPDLFSGITESMSNFGQSLSGMFGRMIP
jgi:quinol-cytochrome oxidoreductase complex cytochrome b subunit